MPDVHFGIGATVGSVIPTKGAIIAAAVGVNVGCRIRAVETTLRAEDSPDSLASLRASIERRIPVGNGPGGDFEQPPAVATSALGSGLMGRLESVLGKHPKVRGDKATKQLGTLGGGNHFIEVCLDERGVVLTTLHSGSRGTGILIGTHFFMLKKFSRLLQLKPSLPLRTVPVVGLPHVAIGTICKPQLM